MNEDLAKILEEHEKRIARLESFLKDNEHIPNKGLSIKEFLLQVNPEDEVLTTLCIAYYLERFDHQTSFNTKDIETAFRAAKVPVPENINYKVIKNIEKGLMMEAKEKKAHHKAWNVTITGETYVESRAKQKQDS